MANRKYNPEKSAWKGRSYRKGGTLVRTLREEFLETQADHYWIIEYAGPLLPPT